MISPEPITSTADRVVPRPRRVSAGRRHESRASRQFRRLADGIVKEFPATSGGTLLFSGTSSSGHVAQVAVEVAQQLAQQPGVSVALLDADSTARRLSQTLATEDDAGLAEVLQSQVSVSRALLETDMANVRVLPFGDRRVARNPIASNMVKSTLVELRNLCRYTIIVSGMEISALHAMLGRHSDGTYLVVQLGLAGRQDTSQLASHLTRAGARLLGCVATGVH